MPTCADVTRERDQQGGEGHGRHPGWIEDRRRRRQWPHGPNPHQDGHGDQGCAHHGRRRAEGLGSPRQGRGRTGRHRQARRHDIGRSAARFRPGRSRARLHRAGRLRRVRRSRSPSPHRARARHHRLLTRAGKEDPGRGPPRDHRQGGQHECRRQSLTGDHAPDRGDAAAGGFRHRGRRDASQAKDRRAPRAPP